MVATPEPNHIEQAVNAELLRFTGGGDYCQRDDFTGDALASSLASLGTYRAQIADLHEAGNTAAVDEVRAILALQRVGDEVGDALA